MHWEGRGLAVVIISVSLFLLTPLCAQAVPCLHPTPTALHLLDFAPLLAGILALLWAAEAEKHLVLVTEEELLRGPWQHPSLACCPQTHSLGASMLGLVTQ